jgi:hypothetical protein
MNITKILLSIIATIMIVTTTNATTMCVTDDNNSIILDPSRNGTTNTSDEATKTWTTTFSFGTVSGIAACTRTGGTYAKAYSQYNFDDNHASSTGAVCWCKMTSPVRSAWVAGQELQSASTCASYCATHCSSRVQAYAEFRSAVYGSAGM